MQRGRISKLAAFLVLGLLLALGAQTQMTLPGQMPHGTQPGISLGFHDPKEGSEIQGTEVFVQVMFHGEGDFQIKAPDGTRKPNEGHVDLLLDQTLKPDINKLIPESAGIAHTDGFHTFKDVPAGEHMLVAVLVDGAHYPLAGGNGLPITATVRFSTVTARQFDDLSRWVRRGDLDGDGDLDLVLLGSGMAQLQASSATAVSADLDGDGDEEVLIVGGSLAPAGAGMGQDMSGMPHDSQMKHDDQMEHDSQATMEHEQCTSMMGAEMPHDPEMHDGMKHSSAEGQSHRMDPGALVGWVGAVLAAVALAIALLK